MCPWFFPLSSFNTFILFFIFSFFTIIFHGEHFLCLIYFVFSLLLVCVWVCLSLEEVFFYDFFEDLVYVIDIRFLSFIFSNKLLVWLFYGVPHSWYVHFLCFIHFSYFFAYFLYIYFKFKSWYSIFCLIHFTV